MMRSGTIRCSRRTATLEGDIAAKFLAAVLAQPEAKKLLSSDHFSVDGTLVEAWASMKSVKPKDGAGEPPAQGGGRNAVRPPIRTPGSTAREKARRRSCASSGTG